MNRHIHIQTVRYVVVFKVIAICDKQLKEMQKKALYSILDG